jgi:acetyltransferase-like isoleucine patch superfamily enzyme
MRWYSGTRVHATGPGHRIDITAANLVGVALEISGSGNRLTVGANTRIWGGTIKLSGHNLHCEIGEHCKLRRPTLVVEDRGSRLTIGQHSSGTAITLLAGEGGHVSIGADCMMAAGTDVRNTDGHSVIDAVSNQRINPASDVVIGDHVWIGLGVQVLKGVHVGPNSILAARSLVISDVPAATIVGGVPAKVIRSGVTWLRERITASDAVHADTAFAP